MVDALWHSAWRRHGSTTEPLAAPPNAATTHIVIQQAHVVERALANWLKGCDVNKSRGVLAENTDYEIEAI